MTPYWAGLIAVGVFGLCIGSFLNVCIFRLPRGESLVHPRSRCTTCGRTLSWFDNIPVLSWAVQRGRCRTCGQRVSLMYPTVELVTAVVFVLLYSLYGLTPLGLVRIAFACALIVLFAIDLEHHLLPNVITLPAIAIGLISSAVLPPGIVDALIGVVVGGGVLCRAEGRGVFGGIHGKASLRPGPAQ